jgi:hypothetical protein
MPKPKASTRRTQIKPIGVSERLGDAPPTRYRYGGTGKTDGAKTYVVADQTHRFDGTCHSTCEDVR